MTFSCPTSISLDGVHPQIYLHLVQSVILNYRQNILRRHDQSEQCHAGV
jgi:hypothetical protein